eukprot:CAMPEP_0118676036 /NCGR_PEP_ID=MMETSP0800-20121206/1807_1 /TAXON_ID=210618 ORGANISM="Striatella unipunctata, Strain CCMP2910" /NCGR_SAMPLE_ID=MMETSP0800 /ASSEMBLY_ACC=CAM_ASM_000638 /LENGTH=946 /DNA_ID=CAMNT_0006571471 /DNA_START=562 /DNA_END=3402 /DNA_ORIENTATION=-
MAKFFSFGVMGVSECYVSITRLQQFLETPDNPLLAQNMSAKDQSLAISLKDTTCYWDAAPSLKDHLEMGSPSLDNPPSVLALDRINLTLKRGELCCIIGPVGCGKSALIQAMAGELLHQSGQLERHGSVVSYAPQDPWIMNGTVRENIVMGSPFDTERYNEVVKGCGLTVDFERFPDGDQTLVGDRGVQCSGGQRARIGLSRALYRVSDLVLLDDPLSAVDAKVGRLIFYSAIQDLCVKRGRSVALATHQHQFIGDQRCVLMDKGAIVHVGSYASCVRESGGALAAAYQASGTEGDQNKKINEKNHDDAPVSDQISKSAKKDDEARLGKKEQDTNVDQREDRNKGNIEFNTYIEYARAMGGPFWGLWAAAFLCFLFTISQCSTLLTISLIGKWAEQSIDRQNDRFYFVLIGSLGFVIAFLSVTRSVLAFQFAIKSSQRLHDKMTNSVLRAKIEFFDTNPMGRILNRFSADVGSNDDLLPSTLHDFWTCSFLVLGSLATAIAVLPFTLVVFPPLMLYFLRVRYVFLKSSRELKRLEGLARSPIYAMISESLNGIATIRANGALDFFRVRFQVLQDNHSRAFFCFIASSRWLGYRMDAIMTVLIIVSCFLAVICKHYGWLRIDPAVLGLALSMLLRLTGLFQWAVRQSAEVVNQMVSIERVTAYGNLPSEAPLTMPTDEDNQNWPKEGSIDISDLSVRYRASLPLALSGINVRISGGSRVGIVGRTGSGKSSLCQALFRLLEAEMGTIRVDGVNVKSLGLHKLRTQMSVIAQTPVLFSGSTIRQNIDPFSKHDKDTMVYALEDVQMLSVIEALPGGLDHLVNEGGSNFSVGQRQLLCLARAVLRKNKILVLDEPSANVDSRTDMLIQNAVSKSFAGATILAVAHRLDTVIEYDKILVLGDGKVLEFGAPADLLSIQNGHFTSMVNDTGAEMAKELRRRAQMPRHKLKA